MRVPRFRFRIRIRIRTLMIATAIVAVLVAAETTRRKRLWQQRRMSYRAMADSCRTQAYREAVLFETVNQEVEIDGAHSGVRPDWRLPEARERFDRNRKYWLNLASRYDRADRYYWLTVDEDSSPSR